ncbi:OAH/OAS sulfhydrylase [Thiovulum sp. ES]|nr:OAH/OAS sulfhydrylase [Thiovulum sp. ES]
MNKETLAIHGGYEKDSQRTMAVPIYQTTAYEFRDVEHAGNLFELKELGNIYTRLTNPTNEIFEKRVALLENGMSGLATGSGMSAITYAVLNLIEAGGNIVASSKLYGGTITLFTQTLKRFGISVKFFDKPEEIENLIDDKTGVIFFESLSNPSIDVANIDEVVKVADKHGIVTVVDNTVATPVLCNPISFGADIVVHSASKYMTGQGLAIGGVIVDSEKSNKKLIGNSRYPQFNTPEESYHGFVFANVPTMPIFNLRVRIILLRDMGSALSPFNSWLFIQGLETISLRVEKHSQNALEIAKFLETHPAVKSVNYPKLENSKQFDLAEKYLSKGGSGLLSFEVESFEKAKEVIEKTEIFSLVANIGDSKSIITHPASTTHQQLSAEELEKAGISKSLIRLSVGLENVEDLIADLKKAL